jgi:hypothetical protein
MPQDQKLKAYYNQGADDMDVNSLDMEWGISKKSARDQGNAQRIQKVIVLLRDIMPIF